MAAVLLDGEAVAARVRAECAERVARLAAQGVVPGLGTILVVALWAWRFPELRRVNELVGEYQNAK